MPELRIFHEIKSVDSTSAWFQTDRKSKNISNHDLLREQSFDFRKFKY